MCVCVCVCVCVLCVMEREKDVVVIRAPSDTTTHRSYSTCLLNISSPFDPIGEDAFRGAFFKWIMNSRCVHGGMVEKS